MRNYLKTVIYILTISILTLSCSNNSENAKTTVSNADSSKVINDKEKISSVSLKFEPYISFGDFKVTNIDNKRKAKLDLSSNISASNFRTRLMEAYEADTSNFSGHYTFVHWGCGSTCQSSLLIDRQTGKIYDSPGASLGYEYHVESRMLLANPPDTSGHYDDCFYCKPIIYLFDEETNTFIEKK